MGAPTKLALSVTPYGEHEVVQTPQSGFLETPQDEKRTHMDQRQLDTEFAAHGLGRAPPEEGWEDVEGQTPSRMDGNWRTAAGAAVGGSGTATPSKKLKMKKRFTGSGPSTSHTAGDAPSSTQHAPGDHTPKGGRRKLINQFRRGGKYNNTKPAKADVGVPSMTNEMLAGQLPVMILKTWLDRDEEGHRAVPVLLGNLRFRIGDSVSVRSSGRNTGRELYKIECEYGDGAIKWVVYRDVRDFLALHAHYKKANLSHRVTGSNTRHVSIPDFPRNGEFLRDWVC